MIDRVLIMAGDKNKFDQKGDRINETLKAFLLYITEPGTEFQELENAINRFNLFDVLRVARTEIRHSNVLAWLLDPAECHGYSDSVIKSINSWYAKEDLQADYVKLLTGNFNDAMVYRERSGIDILVVSASQKYVLCIENKIDTDDHDDQLNRYERYIENNYEGYLKVFLYLTPDGREPTEDNSGNWYCISYKDIVSIIEKATTRRTLDQDVNRFVEQYLDILRRICMEKENIELCQKIYRDHKAALDMIFENRPDDLQAISGIVLSWCKKNNSKIKVDEEQSTKRRILFKTDTMDQIVPAREDDAQRPYNFEVVLKERKEAISYYMRLGMYRKGSEGDYLERIDKIIKSERGKDLSKNYNVVWSCSSESVVPEYEFDTDEDNDGLSKKIESDLDEMFKELEEVQTRMAEKNKDSD